MSEPTTGFEDKRGSPRYATALRRHWFMIVVVVLSACSAAALYSLSVSKRYEAEADLVVSPFTASDETFLGIGLFEDPTSSVFTAARFVRTPQVASAVARRLELPASRGRELAESIDVKPLSQSNVVAIVASAESASDAARVANTFAKAVISERKAMFQESLAAATDRERQRLAASRRLGRPTDVLEERLVRLESLIGTPDPTVRILSRAVPPDEPVWPKPFLTVAVAGLAGLLLGIGAAFFLEFHNPWLLDEEELLLEQRLPILARVPRVRERKARRYLTGRDSLPGESWEAYRALRASLAAAGSRGAPPRSVLVTSAMAGEGKTMTVVSLGITMAAAGNRVVLVDGDLRHPMLASFFGIASGTQGLGTLLSDDSNVEDALVTAPGFPEELRLLPVGAIQAHLIDLLAPRRIERVIEQLKEESDVIVIDSAPLTEVADALALADAVDIVLVAVRLGLSRRDRLNELRQFLAQRGILPAGLVVTGRRRRYGYAGRAYVAPIETPIREEANRGVRAAAAQRES